MATRKPLEGIKVIDLGSVAVEPVNCKHLADYGATVVRIESHRSPDITRFTMPYYERHIDGSMFFGNCNSSKLSISLDLEKPGGMAIFWKLVKWADVLSCGRPGEWMYKWGLDYDSVRKVKPEIVYYITSITGIRGRDSGLFGHGLLSNAIMGMNHLTGWPDRGPSAPCGAFGDSVNFLFGAIGILAALEQRERTGQGQCIDHAHVEGFLWSEAPWLLDYAVNKRVATRSGNSYPLFASNAPYGAFPCIARNGRDRWVAICVTNDKEWLAFCNVIGQPGWTKETRFTTALGRRQNEAELEKLVSEWTRNHTAEEVEKLMQAAGVPASAAESNKDVFEDPQLKERGYIRSLKHKELGVVPFCAPPFKLSKTPDTQFTAPTMGEHCEYILKEILGMSEEEINNAIVEEAITTEYNLPIMKMGG